MNETPLYQGSNVTTAQCLLLVMAYVIRHHLTHEALQDLLVLLNVLLPGLANSRGSWVECRGSWVKSRGSWVKSRGSWVKSRGSWVKSRG